MALSSREVHQFDRQVDKARYQFEQSVRAFLGIGRDEDVAEMRRAMERLQLLMDARALMVVTIG